MTRGAGKRGSAATDRTFLFIYSFKLTPHGGLDDRPHEGLVSELVDCGTAFLGPARVSGRSCIRACLANLSTTRREVDSTLNEILSLAVAKILASFTRLT
jgi:hypothetical protein